MNWNVPECSTLARSGTNVMLSSGACWDVSSKATLTHGGGGDTQAISNMIKYAISQYKVDASRVFVTGGSSGGGYRNPVWPAMRRSLVIDTLPIAL